ncbi:MAG: sigma-70 family RNA polymerase sigma factor [Bacteroidetes bacterium]|nr:sigma-70 family RNA polymerase sigma factor [Bacteroidota bacterium]MBU1721094.1 sigma-70 family RNA polymerase sigma factor [Bacteroidota bacterium]
MEARSHNDQELVSQYINGNESSLEVLIRRHKSRLYSYILYQVKDSEVASDLFQDTFMKVIRTLKLGQYNEEGKFLPWVMRISHNLVIDHFRREQKMPIAGRSTEDFDIFSTIRNSDENIEDKMIREQISSDVRRLIDFLPDEQREVLLMRHYKNMSFKDIADSTNVSINTALGRMRYAILNLRKLIAEKEIILTI